jgi:hypothetical protein
MAALKIALELVDEGKLPYAAANEFCRRLINQALYERIIVTSTDDARGEPTPLYAQLIPLARRGQPRKPPPLPQTGRKRPQVGPKTAQTPFFGACVHTKTKWRGGRDDVRTRKWPGIGYSTR